MGSHNSPSPELTGLLAVLIERDLAKKRLWLSDKHMERDLRFLRQRSNAEGLSFLTKTLPGLGKALDRALLQPVPFEAPLGFKTQKNSKLPSFLGDLFRNVFDDGGELLPLAKCSIERQTTAVAGIRQLAYSFYKLDTPYTDHETRRVIDRFRAVESELALQGDPDPDSDRVLHMARRLISAVVCNIDPREILPRHGPGSVATGESSRQKSRFSRIYQSVDEVYSFTEYFTFGLTQVADDLQRIQGLESLPLPVAKVTLVPKDSRGPRLISMEPLEVQWIQQGLMSELYNTVERHPMTKGHVSFTDQSINQRLALQNSCSGDFATIDMRDASDRVSLKLVKALFAHTALLEGLLAARSHATLLPDGEVIALHKFAPMGSAVCFPVEALVFWAIAVSVLHVIVGMPRQKALDSVYVYGDDIVVPTKWWTTISAAYGACNLEVNISKCAVRDTGVFRESCGVDAFRGYNVTPVRIKRIREESPHLLVKWVPTWVAQSNLCYERGFTGLADAMMKMVRDVIDIPVVDEANSHLAIAFVRPYSSRASFPCKMRFNKRLQRSEIRGWIIHTKQQAQLYDGYEEVLRRWAPSLQASRTGTEGFQYNERHTAKLRRAWLPIHIG